MSVFICRTDGPTCDVPYRSNGRRYFCRLEPKHDGKHDCPADRDDRDAS